MPQADSSFLNQSRRNPRFMLIAIALTAIIVGAFFYESHVGFGKPPQKIIYVASWPATRTARDAVRAQNVQETARRAAIAQFEIERGQALRSRAESPRARADAEAHITQSRVALARWSAAHSEAQATLDANRPQDLATPLPR